MRCPLQERERTEAVVLLAADLAASHEPCVLRYACEKGALLRLDGRVAGAFDREHRSLVVAPSPFPRELTLEVERSGLPTNGLPCGPGWRWSLLLARSTAEPHRAIECCAARSAPAAPPTRSALPLWGHSHLDVAWLWSYGQTRRKAARTFANAVALLEADPGFVFMQSQPQLYEFVREADAELFARVAALARDGRFDPSPAAMWVEPDCNIPSGESLLRQMLVAHRYCVERFGTEPSIAWLPDTFGFARTLPTLLAHAGIPYFATTKLQWNDTARFPHAQFRWRGPDASVVVAASIDRMEGGCEEPRVRTACERGEPLIVGYGDGGGGPTGEQLLAARAVGLWERPRAWFDRLAARPAELPVHDDELYLEYHRGVYTTHHDVKAHNAELERSLALAEELAAWCVAVRAPAAVLTRMRAALREAWEIVLRNQFHDVLTGTSIAAVYDDARLEYARAHEIVASVATSARAMLPRGRTRAAPALCAPVEDDGGYRFENGELSARVLPSGAIVELSAQGGPNVVAQANVLALYRDRPRKWEAWNLDAGYERSRRAARPRPPQVERRALEVPFQAGRSPATMRVSLRAGEPFLRVELAIDWRERRRLLRVENWFTVATGEVTYGAPHGVVTRSARTDTPHLRARYEVPGQRYALLRDAVGGGAAVFSLDTYGWSARALPHGGVALGHSLLRGTTWPDPRADAGEAGFTWAYAPVAGRSGGVLEREWLRFATEPGVPLFTSDDDSVLVVACKPAEDGDGVVVRVRECGGEPRRVVLRCGGRMRDVAPVDACERTLGEEACIERESILASIRAFGLRSFRVRF